jgi:hypothetical protein
MEKVPGEGYRFFLLVGEFDFCGVEVGVELATDGQSCGRCGVGDEVDDGLVSFEWSSAPVLGDSGEESVFDLVPFAGAGRVMGDDDVQPSCRGESCEFVFPQPESVSVGSAAIGGDEDSAGVGVFLFAHVLPPLVDRGDGED